MNHNRILYGIVILLSILMLYGCFEDESKAPTENGKAAPINWGKVFFRWSSSSDWNFVLDKYKRPINVIESKMDWEGTQEVLSSLSIKPPSDSVGISDVVFSNGDLEVMIDKGDDGLFRVEVKILSLQRFVDSRSDRIYLYPSIMEEELDGSGCLAVGLWGYLQDHGWNDVPGPRDEIWRIQSPAMTFDELMNKIHFNLSDVSDVTLVYWKNEHQWHRQVKGDKYTCLIRWEDPKLIGEEDGTVYAEVFDPYVDSCIRKRAELW